MTLMLGTPVTYTHRAAVARLRPAPVGFRDQPPHWELGEGARKNFRLDDYTWERDLFEHWKVQMFSQPVHRGKAWGDPMELNKTIMVWPEEGSGVITGLVRRGIGRSIGSSGYDENFDPGYFRPSNWFELYVVRHELRGLDYFLIPQWAVSVIDHGSREYTLRNEQGTALKKVRA